MSKLDDLRAMVAAMTEPPWQCNEPNLSIQGDLNHRDGPVLIAELGGEATMADGPGIVALRSAAPAMLDLVEAVDSFLAARATLPGDRYYIPRAHAVEKLRAARKRLEDLP